MVQSLLNELASLGLWSSDIVTFDGGFGVKTDEVLCLAAFVIISINLWWIVKRLIKKLI